jgi:hypothetical protein
MSHIERKSFVFPVEKLGDSWGALRKAWLAFNIAKSNGDTQTMRDYVRIIRTLQLQMAIPGTIFDDDIFDEEDERELFVEICRLEMPWKKQEQIALDRSPDYEVFRNNNKLDNPFSNPAFPEIQFISEVPDYTIHKYKGCSYQPSDYRVPENENENENEKDIKRKARS